MQILEAIRNRRSIRRFSHRSIPGELMTACLEASRLAPSACNVQPFTIIIVDQQSLIEQIAQQCCSALYQLNDFIKTAPALAVFVMERQKLAPGVAGSMRKVEFSLIDTAIAAEHFVLQAQAQGLGTCWIGWMHEGKLKSILGIPRERRIPFLIAVGFPSEAPAERGKKDLSQIARFNNYNGSKRI